MAIDPSLLFLLLAAAPAADERPDEPEAIACEAPMDPDEAWNYAQDPYPPCSMG